MSGPKQSVVIIVNSFLEGCAHENQEYTADGPFTIEFF